MKNERILNLTQHEATAEQRKAGVIDCTDRKELSEILTFNMIPTSQDLEERAKLIVNIVRAESERIGKDYHYEFVMIGGAPYFMSILEERLKLNRHKPVYAYSERKVSERTVDGKVVKTFTFEHLGFVRV